MKKLNDYKYESLTKIDAYHILVKLVVGDFDNMEDEHEHMGY